MIQLTAPYIPGYLAFREADFLVEKVENLKKTKPDIIPQVINLQCKIHPINIFRKDLGNIKKTPIFGLLSSMCVHI
jgi:hypothetical protein